MSAVGPSRPREAAYEWDADAGPDPGRSAGSGRGRFLGACAGERRRQKVPGGILYMVSVWRLNQEGAGPQK